MATHWVAISLGMTIMTLNETSPLRDGFPPPGGVFLIRFRPGTAQAM